MFFDRQIQFMDLGRGLSANVALPFDEYRQVLQEFADELDGQAEVRQAVWAGPYEMIILGASLAGGVGGAVSGLCAVLSAWASRHPDVKVTVQLDPETTVELDGREIPDNLRRRIDERLAELASSEADVGMAVEPHVDFFGELEARMRAQEEADTRDPGSDK